MTNKILILGGRGTFPTEYENNVTRDLITSKKGVPFTPWTVTQDNEGLIQAYIQMGKENISRSFTPEEENAIHQSNIENLDSKGFTGICLVDGWRNYMGNSIRELEYAADNGLDIFEVILGGSGSTSSRTLRKIVPVLEFKYTFPTLDKKD